MTEPVVQLLDPVVLASGNKFVFKREIQVDGSDALKLDLQFEKANQGEKEGMKGVWVFIILLIFIPGLISIARKV